MTTRRRFIQCVGLMLLALTLAGCEPPRTVRYRLTLDVETPEGVKSGFSVVEINVSFNRITVTLYLIPK